MQKRDIRFVKMRLLDPNETSCLKNNGQTEQSRSLTTVLGQPVLSNSRNPGMISTGLIYFNFIDK